MPRLRQCAATRTSSIKPREAPCAQSRQDAEFKAADHGTFAVFRDHKLDMRVTINRLKCPKIARRQRRLDPFPAAAERIVRQHPHDGFDVLAPGAADRDR